MTQRGDLTAKLLAALVVLTLTLVAGVAPAMAELKGAFVLGNGGGPTGLSGGLLDGIEGGQFNFPEDVLVDEATNRIYVVDEDNNRIQRFAPDGSFEIAFGWNVIASGGAGDLGDAYEVCTNAPDCQAGSPGPGGQGGRLSNPNGIAQDRNDGSLYVYNDEKARVEKFGSNGEFLLTFGRDVNQTTGGDVCPVAPGDVCQDGVPGAEAGQLNTLFGDGGVAVHPTTGAVFVSNGRNARIDEYQPDGDFVRAWGWDVVPGGDPDEFEICTSTCQAGPDEGGPPLSFGKYQPEELEVGPTGIVYATDDEPKKNRIYRFDSNAATAATLFLQPIEKEEGGSAFGGITGIEIDQGDGRIHLLGAGSLWSFDPISFERTFESATSSSDFLDISVRAGAFGLNETSLERYLGWSTGPESGVVAYDQTGAPAPQVPSPVAATPTGVHTAQLEASATPNGPGGIPASGRFELRKGGTAQWIAVGEEHLLGVGTSPVSASQAVADLEANREYDVRFAVTKPYNNGTFLSPVNDTFAMPPAAPDVTTLGAQHVSPTSAQLIGRINPNNEPSTYRVEYGPDSEYGSVTPVQEAGTGGTARSYAVKITGLEPDTEYHFRFVATNSTGTGQGEDAQFETRAGAPASFRVRAFEMVTPPDKNNRRFTESLDGTPLIPNVSPDGEALMTTMPFGIVDGGSAVSSGSVNPREIVRRTAAGWTMEPLYNVHPPNNNVTPLDQLATITADFGVVAVQVKNSIFPTNSTLSTRVFGDTGGPLGNGWYDWLEGNPQFVSLALNASGDMAAFDETGTRMVRWSGEYEENEGDGGFYRGLLGDADPSSRGYPNEQQQVSLTASGGSFKLTFEGQQTAAIAYNATAAQVRTALEGLGNIAPGQVTVTGSAGGPWKVTFTAGLGRKDHALMLADSSGLTGTSAEATVTPIRNGVSTAPAGTTEQIDGDVIYTQTPVGSGPRELVDECTGANVAEASEIPSKLASGDIGVQPCRAGQLTSLRGAVGGTYRELGGTARESVAADGSRIYFTSPDPEDAPAVCSGTLATTNCPSQLFVRQYDSEGKPTVRWISRPQVEGQDATLLGPTAFLGASDSGGVVLFQTSTPLTADDPNGGASVPGGVKTGTASPGSWDLYRYELPGDRDTDPNGGTLTRVSGGPGGAYDPSTILNPGGLTADSSLRFLSTDGRRAYFVTRELLGAPSDSWNAAPRGGSAPITSPSFDARNLYLYDAAKSGDERWKFIAQLPTSGPNRCTVLDAGSSMSVIAQGGGLNQLAIDRARGTCLHGTPDGRAVVFETTAKLATSEADEADDIYLYDADADELIRISSPPNDESAYDCGSESLCNADLGIEPRVSPDTIGRHGVQWMNLAVAPDGTLSAFFESRAPLVPEDKNGTFMDVYEWQAGELHLVSTGDANHDSYFAGNSTDGEDVLLFTSQSLDPREIDRDWDVYDARVGGGFPYSPPRQGCDVLGGACRGAVTPPPAAGAPPSANLEGAGNVVEKPRKRRCAKGKRRAGKRCVKAHRQHRKGRASQ